MPISEVFNIDNMEYMKSIPNGYFELAIVDPPYGVGFSDYERGGQGEKCQKRHTKNGKKRWDDNTPNDLYFEELFRISKNQIIWGGNYFPLPPTRCILCWNKMQPWENFSQFEMAWTSFDSPAGLISISNTGGANLEPKIHPTQKPVKLYTWALMRYAKAGYKILDTHVGSGSSRIACFDLGLEFTGYEISHIHFQDQENRFETHLKNQKAQPKLFA